MGIRIGKIPDVSEDIPRLDVRVEATAAIGSFNSMPVRQRLRFIRDSDSVESIGEDHGREIFVFLVNIVESDNYSKTMTARVDRSGRQTVLLSARCRGREKS
jgi:hypothetical protein